MTVRVWPRRLMTALYWFVALEFALGAVTKYWPGDTFVGPAYSTKFVDWGYPSWMRFVVGGLEGLCAILLVIPNRRTRFVSATVLAFVLTGAATTHIINHDPVTESWAAPTYLVISGILALVNWPADWRDVVPGATPTAVRARSQ
jgi:uncharacterized membrane protein YphA (DoxX/SURF4 family)